MNWHKNFGLVPPILCRTRCRKGIQNLIICRSRYSINQFPWTRNSKTSILPKVEGAKIPAMLELERHFSRSLVHTTYSKLPNTRGPLIDFLKLFGPPRCYSNPPAYLSFENFARRRRVFYHISKTSRKILVKWRNFFLKFSEAPKLQDFWVQCIENGVESTNLRQKLQFRLTKRTCEHIRASKCIKWQKYGRIVGCFNGAIGIQFFWPLKH